MLISKKINSLLLFFFLFTANVLHAVDTVEIRDKDKTEKLLQFHKYVQEYLVKKKAKQKKWWRIRGSLEVGYDNNTSLSPDREGDIFHQEKLYLTIAVPDKYLTDIFQVPNIVETDDLGITFKTIFRDFVDEERYDYHIMSVKPFFEVTLFDYLTFDADYTFQSLRYIHNNQIDYYSHYMQARLKQPIYKKLSHRIHFKYRIKDYVERRAKSGTNTPLGEERMDYYYEPGYSLLYELEPRSEIGVTAAWKMNESNDEFRDFNDYRGYKIYGFINKKLMKRLRWIAQVGYNYTDYDSRVFTGSDVPQRDHYYYVGSYAYITLTKDTRLDLSYLYGQNQSNDDSAEYSFSRMTAGVSFAF